MELYTLVSLSLAVFGGTYAALSALRTHFEKPVREARSNCDGQLAKIENFYPEGKMRQVCKKKQKSICRAEIAWNLANTIPAILFAVFIFLVMAGVLYHWD